jgi:hypothetical protein
VQLVAHATDLTTLIWPAPVARLSRQMPITSRAFTRR